MDWGILGKKWGIWTWKKWTFIQEEIDRGLNFKKGGNGCNLIITIPSRVVPKIFV